MKNEIKLIIFDLDGVLVDAREMHYDALNWALEKEGQRYIINREEHLSTYDGLPTAKKLKILSEFKGLPETSYKRIWENKQAATLSFVKNLGKDERLCFVLSFLKSDGYKIAVASNSIRETVKFMLLRKGFMEYVDYYYSNEDVRAPKPSPEIYMRCMLDAQVSPSETIIVEDSPIGRNAAISSGARLIAVKNPEEVTIKRIMDGIDKKKNSIKWQGENMNVLIPMAGQGSRFETAGFVFPKPLIEIQGKPMIQMVVENLNIESNFIFIVQKLHYEKYNLMYLLNLIAPGCKIIQVEGITEGAACTTLLAKEFINNDMPLLISNSDQFLEWDSNQFMYSMIGDTVDAGLATFKSVHNKWSFARLNKDGFVAEVAEKKPISDIASAGVYYYKKGSDYVKYAEQMISKNIRVNGEFYVCPVFNEAIRDGKRVKIFNIEKMWGTGTPEDLEDFKKYYKGEI